MAQPREHITLPEPVTSGDISLEQLLRQRRSVREYRDTALRLADISQLLWSAQGLTHPRGYRTAPSAGALYPLELYIVAGNVSDLGPGVYHYQPATNRLTRIRGGDQRRPLARSALGQSWIANAPAVVVFAAEYARTTRKYGERGDRYVHMEVGHAAQNLFLQAEALGLNTVVVGAFRDEQLGGVLNIPDGMEPLVLMPVGRKHGSDSTR